MEKTKTKTSKGKSTKPGFVYQLVEDTASPTRLNALKQSAEAFVNLVIEKSENTNNRVAVVTFSSSADYVTGNNAATALKSMHEQSEASEVISAIKGLSASGATDPQTGLNCAKDIFDAYPISTNESRNRVVVFFTDGTPGTTVNKWNRTSTSRANAAVDVSNTLKSSCDATVYAVGIFAGADGSSQGTAYTSNTTSDNSSVVASLGNYFMQHVSSNNGDPSGGYYLSAADSGSLSGIFTEIAHKVEEGGSSTKLTENTVITDTISPYFTVPKSPDDIALQKAAYKGSGDNPWYDSQNATEVIAIQQISKTHHTS